SRGPVPLNSQDLLLAAPPAATTEPTRPYRTGAYAAFGVGLTGVVVGSLAGSLAWSKAHEVRARCEGSRCLPDDEPEAHEARRLAHVATAGFVGAATGALAGITLWLLPVPSGHDVAVSLSPTRASLRATFRARRPCPPSPHPHPPEAHVRPPRRAVSNPLPLQLLDEREDLRARRLPRGRGAPPGSRGVLSLRARHPEPPAARGSHLDGPLHGAPGGVRVEGRDG